MRTVAVLQARTTSTRLPRKALLPLGGYPSAVLAALRAGNSGGETLVATSDDSSDDALAGELVQHGIRVYRGPLHDVLGRFVHAVNDLSDDCIVVRLTGDNVVPDGAFVGELADAFRNSGLDYLSQDNPQSHLPYGLGGEAFRVATLRRAHKLATAAYDREHVGPWISRNCRAGIHVPRAIEGSDFSHLRCTLDDEEDYERLRRLFTDVNDAIEIGWTNLVGKLATLPGEPTFRVPYRITNGKVHSELVLGTVQLGLEYGVANATGKPSEEQAIKIVRHAIAHGVTAIDTARSYGTSESVLQKALSGAWRSRAEVVTKLDPLTQLRDDATSVEVRSAVDRSIDESCGALGTPILATLLLHRWDHYSRWSGAVWKRLLELRGEGKIERLGVSVYAPAEALEALQDPDIEHLQLPMNVLDKRWRHAGVDKATERRGDVVVHARSVFLQGLLLSRSEYWPDCGCDTRRVRQILERLSADFQRDGVADLCLAYVRSQPWITAAVVGCETLVQLEQNLCCCLRPKLNPRQVQALEDALPEVPETLLNPSLWKLVNG